MRDRFGLRLMGGILVVAALFAAGFYCYNLGLSQGVAEAGRAVAGPSGGAPVFVMWPRPWGVGFGLFPFFPLLVTDFYTRWLREQRQMHAGQIALSLRLMGDEFPCFISREHDHRRKQLRQRQHDAVHDRLAAPPQG